MRMFQCRACLSEAARKKFSAREMMFGSREEFEYVECAECGSVQIAEIPTAQVLARHYPADYYAFELSTKGKRLFRRVLASLRTQHLLGAPNLLGALFARIWPLPATGIVDLLRRAEVKWDAGILDVGCGSGALLDELASMGFRNLLGADPFLERELVTPNGVRILKTRVNDVRGKFGVVMFHHSLEHVPDPVDTLTAAQMKLHPEGLCIVRVPTTSSEAWELYGKDWVQLDPPRHLLVPSRTGMAIMGQRSGLALEKMIDDSTDFQFWASEQYQRNIQLYRNRTCEPRVSREELAEYERRAAELNARSRGDQAAFIFRKGG
jgi:SAM-dependent methyltransferase